MRLHLLGLIVLVLSCGGAPTSSPASDRPGADAGEDGSIELRVLHGAGDPLSTRTNGCVALTSDGQAIVGATRDGLAVLALDGTVLYERELSVQEDAPAASAIATREGTPDVVFMTQGFDAAGEGTLGVLDTKSRAATKRAAVLDTLLGDSLVVPSFEGVRDAAWIVDPTSSPPSVQAFPFASLGGESGGWRPDARRRVSLPELELGGRRALVLPTNLAFFSERVAAVTFAIAPSPPRVAGGVFFFDPTSATPIATMLVPTSDAATSGLVVDALVSRGRLFVLADEGTRESGGTLTRTGGSISVYDPPAGALVPAVAELPAPTPPSARLATSTPHPVALRSFDSRVVALTFPQGTPAALDVLDPIEARIVESLDLGVLDAGGAREPRCVQRGGDRLYVGTDRGIVVVGRAPAGARVSSLDARTLRSAPRSRVAVP